MKRSITIDIETEDDAKICQSFVCDKKQGCPWLECDSNAYHIQWECNLFKSELKVLRGEYPKRCKACLKADTMPDSPKLK